MHNTLTKAVDMLKSGPDIQVAITGAGRCMAPNLIYLIAQGDVFGKDQPVSLRLVDVPELLKSVEGCAMEMLAAGFPLLKSKFVHNTSPCCFVLVPLVTYNSFQAALLQTNWMKHSKA